MFGNKNAQKLEIICNFLAHVKKKVVPLHQILKDIVIMEYLERVADAELDSKYRLFFFGQ